jgi:hypothetical protein
MAAPLGTPQHVSPFMTTQDVVLDSSSSITLRNRILNTTYEVRGIYITKLYYESCSNADPNNLYKDASQPPNQGYGIMWTPPISIPNGSSEEIGSGYLYNMIFDFLNMQASQQNLSANPPITTPVSGTPGTGTETVNSNTGSFTWCLNLGVTTDPPHYVPGTLTNIVLAAQNIIVTCSDPTTTRQGTCSSSTSVTQYLGEGTVLNQTGIKR